MVFCQGSITSRPTPGINGAGCHPHPLDLVDHDEPRQCLQSELGLRQARKVAGIFQVKISVGGQSPGKGGFSAFTSKRPNISVQSSDMSTSFSRWSYQDAQYRSHNAYRKANQKGHMIAAGDIG